MSEIHDPGEPGNYLLNNLMLGEGSVMRMEDGDAEAVTWLVLEARGTDRPDNTVLHHYALNDAQLLSTINMLTSQAKRRGLLP